jgi:Domain of unknown function (DUF4192)
MTSLRSVGDLLAVVPYLLGFHPADSAVVLGLRDNRIIFQVRGDLPAPADVASLVGYYADLVARQHPTGAVVLGYGDGAAVTPMTCALGAALDARGVRVLDAVRVADGRYWSYLCTDPACCPPEGRAYETQTNPLAVAAIADGCVALPSREALERRLAPVDGVARSAMDEAGRRANDRLTALLDTGPRDLRRTLLRAGSAAVDAALRGQRGGGRLTDDEVAWLAVVLLYLAVRDYAWESVGGDLGVHVGLWTDVVRRCDPELVAAPATLLSFAAWRAGEGAVASIALSRALAADPEYPMARLMSRALGGGLNPAEWEAAAAAAEP